MEVNKRATIIGVGCLALMGVFVICGVVFIAINAVSMAQADTFYDQAVDFDDAGDVEMALDYYGRAIEANPRHAEAYTYRCSLLAYLERYEEAEADCTQAIRIDSGFARAYANRCVVRAETGDLEGAGADCQKAVEIDPEDGYVYDSLGRLNEEQGDLDAALESYTTALTLNESFDATYYNRGVIYRDLEEYDLALEDFLKARELNPDDILYHKTIAYTHYYAGDSESALQAADSMIDRFPDEAGAYYARAWILDSMEEFSKAASDYRETIRLDPTYAVAYWALGNLAEYDEAYDEALDYYCSYVEYAEIPDEEVLDEIDELGGCP